MRGYKSNIEENAWVETSSRDIDIVDTDDIDIDDRYRCRCIDIDTDYIDTYRYI